MKNHLSDDQMARWILGERPLNAAEHVDACADCRGELGRFETALADFHDVAHDYGALFPVRMPLEPRKRMPFAARWALAAAVLVTALIPVYIHHSHRQAALARAIAAREDAVLLRAIDTEISRAVPGSMEPLVNLVSWNSEAN